MRAIRWKMLGLVIGCSLAGTTLGRDRSADIVCRIGEGLYHGGSWRTCERITVHAAGDYSREFYTLLGEKEYRCAGRLPMSILKPLLVITHTFPQQDAIPVYEVALDSTFTISDPAPIDSVLAYVSEKHLTPLARYHKDFTLHVANKFFRERCDEAARGDLQQASYSLKRVHEFLRGRPRHTSDLRRALEQRREAAIHDIITSLRAHTSKQLRERPEDWIKEFYRENPERDAKSYTREAYRSWAVLSEPVRPTKRFTE